MGEKLKFPPTPEFATMDLSAYVLTLPALAKRYRVPYTAVKRAAENLDLGVKIGRWRFVEPGELGELEVGIRALGHKLPPDLPPIEELEVAEEAQPVVAMLEAAS
jgi:hypothetical protein